MRKQQGQKRWVRATEGHGGLLVGEAVFRFLTWPPLKRCFRLSIWSFSNFWNKGLTCEKNSRIIHWWGINSYLTIKRASPRQLLTFRNSSFQKKGWVYHWAKYMLTSVKNSEKALAFIRIKDYLGYLIMLGWCKTLEEYVHIFITLSSESGYPVFSLPPGFWHEGQWGYMD